MSVYLYITIEYWQKAKNSSNILFWHFWHYKYISLLLRWRSKASKWWLHFLCMFKPSFLDLLFWILRQFQNIWKCRWLWSHQISRIMLYPISKMSQTRSRYNILFTYREIIILIIVSPHDLCLRAAWAGSLRDKSSKETIFKIRAQQFNVYVCNVDCHLLVCKIRQPVNCLFRLPLPPKEAWYYVLFYCLRVKVDVLSASKKNSLPNNIQ